MRLKAAEAAEKAAQAAKLAGAGWSTRQIADELGMSIGWVQKHKKSASSDATQEAQDVEYVDISDLDTSDDTTSSSSAKVILTPKQKKYIEERKQREVLYNDAAEGWMVQLSDAQYRAAGSILWWTAIVYPESAPDGWEDRLDATGMPWAKSPLHDKDKWTHDSPAGNGLKDGKPHYFVKGEVYKTGDPKKSHWHIMGKLDKPMKYRMLCNLIQGITHGTLPMECESLAGYFDYMTHLHNPDKYPYWKEDKPEVHNGFAPEMNKAEKKKAQVLIVAKIHEEHIGTWGRLMKEYGHNAEFLDIIVKQSGFFQRCVDHEYYVAHPEARLQYARKQTDRTNQKLDKIAQNIEHMITGEVSDDETDD